jgi:hypothetical protein
MKKLFESIFKSESKLNYEPSTTADGYASDLKIICAHFDRLFGKCLVKCEGHPGFHHRYHGLCTDYRKNVRDMKKVEQMLVEILVYVCKGMVGCIWNKETRTSDRIVNIQSTRNAIRNMIPSFSDKDFPNCSKTGGITIFFTGTYKETPGITSGVAIVTLNWDLEIKDYDVSINTHRAMGCTYTDFRWISNHLERAEKLGKDSQVIID